MIVSWEILLAKWPGGYMTQEEKLQRTGGEKEGNIESRKDGKREVDTHGSRKQPSGSLTTEWNLMVVFMSWIPCCYLNVMEEKGHFYWISVRLYRKVSPTPPNPHVFLFLQLHSSHSWTSGNLPGAKNHCTACRPIVCVSASVTKYNHLWAKETLIADLRA